MLRTQGRSAARRLVVPLAVVLACSGIDEREESISSAGHSLSTVERVLGFERVASTASQSDWFFGPGSTGSITPSTTRTEGATSLQLANVAWAQLQSVRLGPLGQIAPQVTFDLSISGAGSVPWGDVILQADAPSQGLMNEQLGQRTLGGTPRGVWQSVSIPLSPSVVAKLSAATLTDLSVRFTINLPAGSTVLLDRATFGQSPNGAGARREVFHYECRGGSGLRATSGARIR
jgi:hypothetical protein